MNYIPMWDPKREPLDQCTTAEKFAKYAVSAGIGELLLPVEKAFVEDEYPDFMMDDVKRLRALGKARKEAGTAKLWQIRFSDTKTMTLTLFTRGSGREDRYVPFTDATWEGHRI